MDTSPKGNQVEKLIFWENVFLETVHTLLMRIRSAVKKIMEMMINWLSVKIYREDDDKNGVQGRDRSFINCKIKGREWTQNPVQWTMQEEKNMRERWKESRTATVFYEIDFGGPWWLIIIFFSSNILLFMTDIIIF